MQTKYKKGRAREGMLYYKIYSKKENMKSSDIIVGISPTREESGGRIIDNKSSRNSKGNIEYTKLL